MTIDNTQFEIEEKILEYIIQNNHFDTDIQEAKKVFYTDGENLAHMDFNLWLIYDYKKNNGKTFIQEFYLDKKNQMTHMENDILKKLIDTYPSIFEFKELRNEKGLFKDIFTRKEYLVYEKELNTLKFGDLVFSEVIEINGDYKFFGNKIYLPGVFKTPIERNIISHFEKYNIHKQFGSWSDFLDNNRLLLYKYIGAIMMVENKQQQEEDDKYNVWQSLYLFEDFNEVKEKLKNYSFMILEEENKNIYYKMIDEEKILAEFILTSKRGELECSSDKDREHAKSIMESKLGHLFTHYKDEIISLNDII